jgi:hypothetical protein
VTTVNHNTELCAPVSRQNKNNTSNCGGGGYNDDDEHGTNNKAVSIILLLLNKEIKDRSDWVQTEVIWRI